MASGGKETSSSRSTAGAFGSGSTSCAMAGAATNYAYTSYYEDMAHVHFGLRKLAIDADVPHDQLVLQLQDKMARIGVKS